MFCYIPLMGWLISFFDYKAGVPLFETEFVGLKYFRLMAKDYKEVLLVLRNTLVMSGLYLACAPLPMIVAILLNEVSPCSADGNDYSKFYKLGHSIFHGICFVFL